MESGDVNTNLAGSDSETSCTDVALESISKETFRDWYQAREFRQNIREGKPYFNYTDSVPGARRHSPSSLLQCHRKIVYRQENAPEEQRDAHGILWAGQQIEEKIVLPFLQDVIATDNTYIRNSVWVDFTVESELGDLNIKGVTDPVVVDEQSLPLVPTEIKSTSSLDYLDGPKPQHLAQLHAYQSGLSEKYDREITEGVLIYVSRESFELEVFHTEFDAEFWEDTVLQWITTHSEYRLDGQLPPAEPQQDWECKFCSYKDRCGKGNREYSDVGATGFLPRYADYPREKVIEYLESHDEAQLTLTLADEYPDLAEKYDVETWDCPRCSATYTAGDAPFEGEIAQRPLCPNCVADDSIVELRPPVAIQGGQ